MDDLSVTPLLVAALCIGFVAGVALGYLFAGIHAALLLWEREWKDPRP